MAALTCVIYGAVNSTVLLLLLLLLQVVGTAWHLTEKLALLMLNHLPLEQLTEANAITANFLYMNISSVAV